MREVKIDITPIETSKNTKLDQVKVLNDLLKSKQYKIDDYICTDIIPMFL